MGYDVMFGLAGYSVVVFAFGLGIVCLIGWLIGRNGRNKR